MTELRVTRSRETADVGQVRTRLSRVRVWFIDCDDTLYASSRGMFQAIHERMEQFIADRLGVPLEEGRRLQHGYWARYGATFLGLERHHGIAPREFFEATHRFDLKKAMTEGFSRSRLRVALRGLKGRRVLVTNGPTCYVEALLPILGIGDLFDAVVSADDMRLAGRWRCKPDALLFSNLAARFGARPEHCAFVEDSPGNLRLAKERGMFTVWCAGFRQKAPHLPHAHDWADLAVGDLAELARCAVRAREAAKAAQGRPPRRPVLLDPYA